MSELTQRQKVERKLGNVQQSRQFFATMNPDADFRYVDSVLADANRILGKLPDRAGIVYQPVWDRVLGAEKALYEAVLDTLKRKFKQNVALRRDLSAEFVASVLEVCDKIHNSRKENSQKEGRNLLIGFTNALGNSKKLFTLCKEHGVKVPDSVYNEVAKFHRQPQAETPETDASSFGKTRYSEKELKSFINEEERRHRRRVVQAVDAQITNLGNDNMRPSELEEMDHLASALVSTVLERTVLEMVMGQNPKTFMPRWECIVAGIVYELEATSPEPPAENVPAVYEITHKGPRFVMVRFIRIVNESAALTEKATTPVAKAETTPDLSVFKGRERAEKPAPAPKALTGCFIDPNTPAFVPVAVSAPRVKTNRPGASKVPTVVRGVPVSGVGSKAAVSKAKRGKKG